MTILLGILTTCSLVGSPADCGPPPIHGYLSQYAEGVMAGTVSTRQGWGELPADLSGFDGFIAVLDCERIGETAYLSIEDSPPLRVLVSDCSGHTSTTKWMRENNILAEISYDLAYSHEVVCLCLVAGSITWVN